MPSNKPGAVVVKNGDANKLTEWVLTGPEQYTEIPGGSGVIVGRIATANIALTGTVSVDGANAGNNTTVLTTAQTDPTQNGVWTVSTSGAWKKASPFQPNSAIASAGTNYTSTQWYLSAANTYKIVVGALA